MFLDLIARWFSKKQRPSAMLASRRSPPRRLRFEQLERRMMLAATPAEWVWSGASKTGNEFTDKSNWTTTSTADFPKLDALAIFEKTDRASNDVKVDDPVTNLVWQFKSGLTFLDLNGTASKIGAAMVGSAGSSDDADVITIATNDSPTVLMRNGAAVQGSLESYAGLFVGSGTLGLTDRVVLTIRGGLQVAGNTNPTNMQVTNGSRIGVIGEAFIGGNSKATVKITGLNSTLTSTTTTIAGAQGASLELAERAIAITSQDVAIGSGRRFSGEVGIDQSRWLISGELTVSNGTLTLLNGQLNTVGGAEIEALGTVYVATGSTWDARNAAAPRDVDITNKGKLLELGGTIQGKIIDIRGPTGEWAGSGIIEGKVTNSGNVIPGDNQGIGTLVVLGDYDQSHSGQLDIELLDSNPADYDSLSVVGTASLGGSIHVVSAGAPSFHAGDRFDVVASSHGFDGTVFENLPEGLNENNPDLPLLGSSELAWQVSYGKHNDDGQYVVRLEVVPRITTVDRGFDEFAHLGQFAVTLSQASTQPVTVHYSIENDTAVNGRDFTAPEQGTVTFLPDQTTAYIPVYINDVEGYQGDRGFYVHLSDSNGATIDDADAVGVIRDVQFSITPSNVSAYEAQGTVALLVSISAPTFERTAAVTLHDQSLTAKAGEDYQSIWVSTFWDPGDGADRQFTVSIIDDSLAEDLEQFYVQLEAPIAGTINEAQALSTIMIDDNDPNPGVFLVNVAGDEGGAVTVSAYLTAPSGKTVSVQIATADGTAISGTHYTGGTYTLTFAPGETAKAVDISTELDPDYGDKAFNVSIVDAYNATVQVAYATATILGRQHWVAEQTTPGHTESIYRQGVRVVEREQTTQVDMGHWENVVTHTTVRTDLSSTRLVEHGGIQSVTHTNYQWVDHTQTDLVEEGGDQLVEQDETQEVDQSGLQDFTEDVETTQYDEDGNPYTVIVTQTVQRWVSNWVTIVVPTWVTMFVSNLVQVTTTTTTWDPFDYTVEEFVSDLWSEWVEEFLDQDVEVVTPQYIEDWVTQITTYTEDETYWDYFNDWIDPVVTPGHWESDVA